MDKPRTALDFARLMVTDGIVHQKNVNEAELFLLRYMETFREEWARDTNLMIESVKRSVRVDHPKTEMATFYVELTKEELDCLIMLLSMNDDTDLKKRIFNHLKAFSI